MTKPKPDKDQRQAKTTQPEPDKSPVKRKPYKKPVLRVFGKIGSLTQSGTSFTKEGDMCDPRRGPSNAMC